MRASHVQREIFHHLRAVLKKRGYNTAVGDEGGFAPNLKSNEEALALILEAIEKAKYEPGRGDLHRLDAAASSFYKRGSTYLPPEKNPRRRPRRWFGSTAISSGNYPILSIEDGLAEDDWKGWKLLTDELGGKSESWAMTSL